MPCFARFATLNRPAQPAAGVRVRAAQQGLALAFAFALDLARHFPACNPVRRAVLFLAVRAVRGAALQP